MSETLIRTLVSLRQSDLDAGLPWKPVVFVFDDAHIPLAKYKVPAVLHSCAPVLCYSSCILLGAGGNGRRDAAV